MWSFLLSSCLIRKAVTQRPLKCSSVCFSWCSCWVLNTEELFFLRLRSASLERRCARATHLCSGGVSKNLSPVSAVPRWLPLINDARVHLRGGCAIWDRESSLPPGAKKKDEESLVFRSGGLMNGCKLDLTVWKLEIWPVTLMGHLPQKVHARHKECAHSTTKSQDYCANYWVIISAVLFAMEKQRKNTGPSEKCA